MSQRQPGRAPMCSFTDTPIVPSVCASTSSGLKQRVAEVYRVISECLKSLWSTEVVFCGSRVPLSVCRPLLFVLYRLVLYCIAYCNK